MSQSELRDKFISILKGVNFVTPHVVEYIEAGNYICEITNGNIFDRELFGITVVNTDTNKHEFDLCSGGFETLELAREYVNDNFMSNGE